MKRLLVVEDNDLNMALACEILEDAGYEVLEAYDGIEGVQLASTKFPDLILMDLSMPRMNGWDATKAIRLNPVISKIPIIVLTAHALPGEREKAIAIGANGFVTKPLDEDFLLAEIARLLPA